MNSLHVRQRPRQGRCSQTVVSTGVLNLRETAIEVAVSASNVHADLVAMSRRVM